MTFLNKELLFQSALFGLIKNHVCLSIFVISFSGYSLQNHTIDPSGHYLRIKVWVDNQMLFYIPKFEEDISDLVRITFLNCAEVMPMHVSFLFFFLSNFFLL